MEERFRNSLIIAHGDVINVVLILVGNVWVRERIIVHRDIAIEKDVWTSEEGNWVNEKRSVTVDAVTGTIVGVLGTVSAISGISIGVIGGISVGVIGGTAVISVLATVGVVIDYNVVLLGDGHGVIEPSDVRNVVVAVSSGEVRAVASISIIGVVMGPRAVRNVGAIADNGEIDVINILLVALRSICIVVNNV